MLIKNSIFSNQLGSLINESNGSVSRNITLNPVKTSDARRHFCMVHNYDTFGVINDNDSFTDFTVHSKYRCMINILYNNIYSPIT